MNNIIGFALFAAALLIGFTVGQVFGEKRMYEKSQVLLDKAYDIGYDSGFEKCLEEIRQESL